MKSSKYNNILIDPDHMTKVLDGQRALVLQGGGSLGAYEAGAYQALHERISKTDREKGDGRSYWQNIQMPVVFSDSSRSWSHDAHLYCNRNW
jgi:hypothetical protein